MVNNCNNLHIQCQKLKLINNYQILMKNLFNNNNNKLNKSLILWVMLLVGNDFLLYKGN